MCKKKSLQPDETEEFKNINGSSKKSPISRAITVRVHYKCRKTETDNVEALLVHGFPSDKKVFDSKQTIMYRVRKTCVIAYF